MICGLYPEWYTIIHEHTHTHTHWHYAPLIGLNMACTEYTLNDMR